MYSNHLGEVGALKIIFNKGELPIRCELVAANIPQ